MINSPYRLLLASHEIAAYEFVLPVFLGEISIAEVFQLIDAAIFLTQYFVGQLIDINMSTTTAHGHACENGRNSQYV